MFQQRHLLRIDEVLAAIPVAKVSSGSKSDFPSVQKLVGEVENFNNIVVIELFKMVVVTRLLFLSFFTGVQQALIVCVREHNQVPVADHRCKEEDRLPSETVRCNTKPCPAE